MNALLSKILQSVGVAEQVAIPVFIKSPGSQNIAAVVLLAQEEIEAIFGIGVSTTTTQSIPRTNAPA